MRVRRWSLGVMVGVLLGMLLTGCGNDSRESKPVVFKVGIAYSLAGKRDTSYGQAAALGVELAKKEFPDVDIKEVEPAQLSDLDAVLMALGREGRQLIIAVGPFYRDSVGRVATQFKGVNFVIIDGELNGMANVQSILFKAEEGSYLVGAIAGLYTKTNKVGIVLATQMPVLEAFRAGYQCGALITRPSVQVKHDYIGSGPESFTDAARAAEVAQQLSAHGADVIYQVAGRAGIGVISAAESGRFRAIGVDSNQNGLAPGRVLTSMLKRVDLAVRNAVKEAREAPFKAGIRRLGLQRNGEDYVGYAVDANNDQLVTPDMQTRVNALAEAIRTGRIVVPIDPGKPCPKGPG